MQTQSGFMLIQPIAAMNRDLGAQFFDVTPAQNVPIRAASQCLPALLKFRLTNGDVYKTKQKPKNKTKQDSDSR